MELSVVVTLCGSVMWRGIFLILSELSMHCVETAHMKYFHTLVVECHVWTDPIDGSFLGPLINLTGLFLVAMGNSMHGLSVLLVNK